jgi:antitoxin FitA
MSTTITLKNIPDDIYTRLKETAEAHHRSLNSEIIACLETLLMPNKVLLQDRIERARKLREKITLKNFDPTEIDAAIEEGRP